MVVTAQEVKLLTADDLLRLYSKGVRGELIRGVLCKTMAVRRRTRRDCGESGY